METLPDALSAFFPGKGLGREQPGEGERLLGSTIEQLEE